jgi:multiple sugar transport system permease protein
MMKPRDALTYLILTVLGLLTVTPFILMVLISLMTQAQSMAYPPSFWPSPATVANYQQAVSAAGLGRYFLNSMVVAVATTAGQLLFSSMAGYAFARFRFAGREGLFLLVLATMMIPTQVNLVPLFSLMANLGLVDTYAALILPGLVGAFGVFLMRQAFLAFPTELEDAALIDGLSPWGTFWRIALPLSAPALASLGIFSFVSAWNAFLWPLVVTNSDTLFTLPVGLAAFKSSFREVTDWGVLMAATTLTIAPAVIAFLLGQKHFVRGLAAGAVKE